MAAYVYGLAPVTLAATIQRFPRNTLVAIGKLADATERTVVAPNADTLYMVSRIELGDGPLVLDAPDPGERYATQQLLDAYTNDFAYIGERKGSWAIVPPGYTGDAPAGVTRVEAPTKLVWLIGRIEASGSAGDVAAAARLAGEHALTPLADWLAGTRTQATVIPDFPKDRAETFVPGGLAFFDALSQRLADTPPPPRDACALRAFKTMGIAPGAHPSADIEDPGVRAALAAARRAGAQLVQSVAADTPRRRGWLVGGPWIGRFGTRYLARAVITRVGLGANDTTQALYPIATTDSAGRPLDGARRYRVRFAPGQLPPVRAFWSLTAYDGHGFLADNAIHRFAIGDRTAGLRRDRDGGLTILVQHDRPAGGTSNWLPAPSGRLRLMLRLYLPTPRAARGDWPPPVVQRVDQGA